MELFGKVYSMGEIVYRGVMAICVTVLAFVLIRAYVTYFKSGMTKGKVHRALAKLGALRGWKVLRDVTISAADGPVRVDHAVVGPWGVLLFNDLHGRGCYFGKLEEQSWARTDGEEEKATNRTLVPNPGKECEKAVAALRQIFAREKVYNMQVEWFVPVTGKQVKSFISGGRDVVVTVRELRGILSRSKYEKDNGVDIQKITALLQG